MPGTRSGAGPEPAEPPRAVLVGGAPGTGKSTLAAALAPPLHAALLDLDVVTGPLTEVVAHLVGATGFDEPRLAALTRTPRYRTLFALATDNLRCGRPVVLVAPFTAERTPAGWAAAAHQFPDRTALTLVWLHLPAERLVARLRQRAAARDAGKIVDPAAFLAVHSGWPQVPHLALDASPPVAHLVARVLAELAR